MFYRQFKLILWSLLTLLRFLKTDPFNLEALYASARDEVFSEMGARVDILGTRSITEIKEKEAGTRTKPL